MSEFGPTTDEVADYYDSGRNIRDETFEQHYMGAPRPDYVAEFYAWLNEERAKVWDQGWKSGFTDMTGYLTGPPTCNPYREGVE